MTWRALSVRPSALAAALTARAAFAPPTPDGWKKRCQPDCPVGPGGYCSPRHRTTVNSRNEGYKRVLTTWRAISGRPYWADPNTFTNHVPIPQGRWTKLPEVGPRRNNDQIITGWRLTRTQKAWVGQCVGRTL